MPPLFLVELGAAMSVASTALPCLSSKPWLPSKSLTLARMASASLCLSSRWRNRKMVLSSGIRPFASNCANSRYTGTSKKASSIAGSDRLNHCCTKCTRSIVSKAKGGRPVRPSG